jgi:hypothetical protein
MSNLKLFLLILTLSLSNKFISQNFYDSQLNVFNWGYGKTISTVDIPSISLKKVGIGHFPLTYEYLSRKVYVHSDFLTPLIDLTLGAFNRGYWWGHERDRHIVNGGDWPLLRLGFGGYVHDKFGIYFGGHWGYSIFRVAPGYYDDEKRRIYSITLEQEIGGHTFGPSFHQVLDLNNVLIRNSILYDFVSDGFDGKIYTRTLTWDIMGMYKFSNDKLGIFANYVLSPGREDIQISKFRFGLSILLEQ